MAPLSLASSPPKRSRAKSSSKSSTTTPFNVTNPFIAPPSLRSRPTSPVKRTSGGIPVSDSFRSQAGGGVIRKGGVEIRLDVVTNDYVPPPKAEIKRSKSTPAVNRAGLDQRDRFITQHETTDITAVSALPQSQVASPGHTARLAAATGVPHSGVSQTAPPCIPPIPPSPSNASLRGCFTLKGMVSLLPLLELRQTKVSTQPGRVLDALGMADDSYLNLFSWSCQNAVAVVLEASIYIWKADTGAVVQLGEAPKGSYVFGVDFSNDCAFLGVGNGIGRLSFGMSSLGRSCA